MAKAFSMFDKADVVDGDECVVRTHMGHLCGYTRIPKTSLPEHWHGNYDADGLQYLNVHGGITYAQVEGDYCVFGFDCAHSGDSERPELSDTAHVMKLAKQMRQQIVTFAGRLSEWKEGDREQRATILDSIRAEGEEKTEMGLGGMIGMLAGMPELGDRKE